MVLLKNITKPQFKIQSISFFSVIKSHENSKFLLNLDAFVETLDISDFKIIERG